MSDKLPLDAKIALTTKMVADLEFYIDSKSSKCPEEQHFKVVSRDEDLGVERCARVAAFKELNKGIKKVAFDTRRIDQEKDRNPRRNLQYWHRSESFIDDETKSKLDIFAKLDDVVKDIKNNLEDQPEWFDSYARCLSSNLDRVKITHADDNNIEVFKPHISYMEQIIYNRYRLTMDDIKKASPEKLRNIIISKDENLESKESFLKSTGGLDKKNLRSQSNNVGLTKDSDDTNRRLLELLEASVNQNNRFNLAPAPAPAPALATPQFQSQAVSPGVNLNFQGNQGQEQQKDSLGALMGGSIRRDGEKSVERTITITIKDNVID